MHTLAFPHDRRRLAAVFAVLVFAGFTASGVRVVIPGLREASRGVAPARVNASSATRGHTRAVEHGFQSGGHAAAMIRRHVAAWVYRFPPLAPLPALRGRPHGVDAGSGAPRRRRWLILGGHGRHGAG